MSEALRVVCIDGVSVIVPRDEFEAYFAFATDRQTNRVSVPMKSELFARTFADCVRCVATCELRDPPTNEMHLASKMLGRRITFNPEAWAANGRGDIFAITARYGSYCWPHCAVIARRNGHDECARVIMAMPMRVAIPAAKLAVYRADHAEFRETLTQRDLDVAIRAIIRCDMSSWLSELLMVMDPACVASWIALAAKYTPPKCLAVMFAHKIVDEAMLIACIKSPWVHAPARTPMDIARILPTFAE